MATLITIGLFALCAAISALIGAGLAALVRIKGAPANVIASVLGLVGGLASLPLGSYIRNDVLPANAFMDHRLEAELRSDPILEAMRQYDPEGYQSLNWGLATSLQSSITKAKLLDQLATSYRTQLRHRLYFADDANALAMARLQYDQGLALQARSPDACARFFSQVPLARRDRPAITQDLRDRDRTLSVAILKQAHDAPFNGTTRTKDAVSDLEAVKTQARAGLDAPALEAVDGIGSANYDALTDPQRQAICRAGLQAYAAILQLPPARGAAVTRELIGIAPREDWVTTDNQGRKIIVRGAR